MTRNMLLAGAAMALVTPMAAHAQATDPSGEAATRQPAEEGATTALSDEGQANADDVIVVTARRTDESLQTVPLSVSAFNERALDRLQATDTTDLQGAVPNLNIVQGRGSSNATNIYIRGIGQPDALQTFDPAVGVYVDGVYYSRIRGTQLDLLDLERVEVLRGPQGTLYGKNTIGGALKLVSKRPGATPRAQASVAAGSYDQLEVKGAVSGPVTEGVGVGFAVLRSTRDGYVDDQLDASRSYNDKDTVAGRATLAIDPSDTIRIDIAGDYAQDRASLAVGQPINDLFSAYGDVFEVANPAADGYDWTGRTTPGFPNRTDLIHYGVSGSVALDLTDEVTLRSISAWRWLDTDDYIDIDASEYILGDVLVQVDQEQFSQEFQLTYEADRLTMVAGAYYLEEDVASHQEAYADDFFSLFGTPLFTFTRTIDDTLTTKSTAGYVNGSFDVTDTVRVSAGLRYTDEKKDYDRTTSIFFDGVNFGTYDYAPDDSWDDWSPMASIDWRPSDAFMLYGRVAKGFKSGGFNGRANSLAESSPYDPETVWSYELGFKSQPVDGMTLNGAVFHSDYKDFQARVSGTRIDPITNAPEVVLSVLNAGKLRIRGAELEATYSPVGGLRLDTQIGYLDAEYREFDDDRFVDFDGSRAFQDPAFAPKWTARIGAQYTLDFASGGSLTLGGQTRFKGRHALAVDNTEINDDTLITGLYQDGYWLHGARIVYEADGGNWALGLYGNNLSDKAYKTDGQEFSAVGGIRTVYYGAPRTFTVRLTARY